MLSVRQWGEEWLHTRRVSGVRDWQTDLGRWRCYVAPANFMHEPIANVTRAMARGWMVELASVKGEKSKKLLAPQTLRNTLNLVRVSFEDALDVELVTANPFRDLRFPKGRLARTGDPWTVLYPQEQAALVAQAPNEERQIIDVAMGTGMREGELWSLGLSDVVVRGDPHIVIRWGGIYGGVREPTKSGKPRKIPLFGRALEAMRKWLEILPRYAKQNPLGLVFPHRCGSHRWQQPPFGWANWLQAAHIERRVRWHDLRHTCASSLVAGWWGRAWSIEEVARLLGHSSIRTTERYAHFAEDFLVRAADESDPARRAM